MSGTTLESSPFRDDPLCNLYAGFFRFSTHVLLRDSLITVGVNFWYSLSKQLNYYTTLKTMKEVLNRPPKPEELKTVLSETELAYFEALILQKREDTQRELEFLLNSLEEQRSADDDDASSIDHHMSDMGSIEESLDLTNRLVERNRKFINELNRALERIQNGTYGICRATGQPIEKERLEFAPHTRYSIAAKNSGLDKRVVMS